MHGGISATIHSLAISRQAKTLPPLSSLVPLRPAPLPGLPPKPAMGRRLQQASIYWIRAFFALAERCWIGGLHGVTAA